MPELRIFVASPPLTLCTVAAWRGEQRIQRSLGDTLLGHLLFLRDFAGVDGVELGLERVLRSGHRGESRVGRGVALPVIAVMTFCVRLIFCGMVSFARFNFTLAIRFLGV